MTLLVVAFGLFFFRAAMAPPPSTSQVSNAGVDLVEGRTQEVVVSAPISRPFAALTDASSEDDAEDASADERATLQQTEDYQNAVVIAQRAAAAYGTYNPATQSSVEWADSVPGLNEELRSRLAAGAERQWPEMADRDVSSEATVVAQSVEPTRVSKNGQSLELSVSVTQQTSSDGRKGVTAGAFLVSLQQSGDGKWSVVGIE